MTSDTQRSDATPAEITDAWQWHTDATAKRLALFANSYGLSIPEDARELMREAASLLSKSTPPKVGSGELDAAGLRSALKEAREEIVVAIAFLGRDAGTNRIDKTIRSLIDRLVKADQKAQAALAAPVDHPEVVGVKIKPLVWAGGEFRHESCGALGGEYVIRARTDSVWTIDGWTETFGTIEAAKAAAQSDYESHIRPALQPSDSSALEAGVAEQPVAWQWRSKDSKHWVSETSEETAMYCVENGQGEVRPLYARAALAIPAKEGSAGTVCEHGIRWPWACHECDRIALAAREASR